jgi:hypothetical protein
MKYLKSYLTAFLTVALFTGSLMANNGDDPVKSTTSTEVRSEIMKMVTPPDIDQEEAGTAVVEFLVSAKNEIVILTVDSSNDYLESYVKSKMNYKKLKTEGIKANKKYKLKFTFQS